ncbi:MAG: protein translocase subunit SecD, partial [Bacteroidota bacterium]
MTRIILIVLAVAASIIFLWPTYKDYSYRKHLSALSGKDSSTYLEQNGDDMLAVRSKRIKLGLDLQGGMRVVLEVDIIQLLDDLAKNKDDNFNTIIKEIRTESLTNEFPIIPALAKKFQDRGI